MMLRLIYNSILSPIYSYKLIQVFPKTEENARILAEYERSFTDVSSGFIMSDKFNSSFI